MSISHQPEHEPPRTPARSAIVVTVQVPAVSDREVESSLAELTQLLYGLGIAVATRIVQKRPTGSAPTYLGAGKLRELAVLTDGPGEVPRGPTQPREPSRAPADVDLVVVDDDISPGQQRSLELAAGVEVLDRTAVILRVFERRATTRQALLEVELARLQYELPRVRDDHALGDREGGGGRASRGHSNVELAKQRARERITAIRRELEAVQASAVTRRQRRNESFRVALIGYTNAGKSSVMRLLTGSDVLIEDRLFATLGTTVRQLAPAVTPRVVVADTVGFINRLPHALVASFRSTLDEVHEASLLLHVVDASDPSFRQQRAITHGVIAEMGASETPQWLVLNKIDRLGAAEREALASEFPEGLQLCAHDPADGSALHERITAFFDDRLVTERLEISYARRGILGEMRDQVRVISEEYGPAITALVRATPESLGRLKKRLAEAG